MEWYINNFSVRVADNTNTDLFSSKGSTILELLSETCLFKYNPTIVVADPFLFVHQGELYLFYEKQVKWYGIGCICMRKTKNMKEWTEEREVLKEPFHLSFPYVFENKGNVYMIPETGHDGSVRLYISEDNSLEHWSLKNKLLDNGIDWVDSSIINDNGVYYLFTAEKATNEPYKQHLFFSKSIYGSYLEHPKSPIYIGDDYGRNAGSVFKYEGMWLRPTQDCSSSYGDNISLFMIEMLTTTEYNERIFLKDILDRKGQYKDGGHQFNFVDFNNRKIVATDYKIKNYNVFEFIRRLMKKIK